MKMYLLGFFRMDIADLKTLFKGLLPPPEVGGELVFDDEMLDLPPGRLRHNPVARQTAVAFFWVTENRRLGTDQAKTVRFRGPGSRRRLTDRPTKCAQ